MAASTVFQPPAEPTGVSSRHVTTTSPAVADPIGLIRLYWRSHALSHALTVTGQEPRLCSGHLRYVEPMLWLNELVPGKARLTARLATRGVFVVVPATKDAGRRPRAPRWHATFVGDDRFPRTPALPGPPWSRDTAESGTLVRQARIALASRAWQARVVLLNYCLKNVVYRVLKHRKIIRKLATGILRFRDTVKAAERSCRTAPIPHCCAMQEQIPARILASNPHSFLPIPALLFLCFMVVCRDDDPCLLA